MMPNMVINFFNNYDNPIPFSQQKVGNAVAAYFTGDWSVSLILVDAATIKDLNEKFRGINHDTDVLSFPTEDGGYRGDIFICVDRVISQAALYNHSPEREFAFLLVHGILHLLGYDHCDKKSEKEMFEKQEAVLTALNYRRKYE